MKSCFFDNFLLILPVAFASLKKGANAAVVFLICWTTLLAQEPHKTRLPKEFSEHQPTILPLLTSDGKRLYFDRKHHPQNTGATSDYDEIWFADRLPNGTWSKPQSIGAPLNTMSSDVFCSLSPDDRTALVYGVYDAELPVKNEGFSLTRFNTTTGAWSFPVPIRIENFYNRAKKYYARLAPDNRTLLLALQRDDALGGLDLYVSFRKAAEGDTTMVWSEPKHLGSGINTPAYEGSPHLAADGKTLYFSSEGLDGSGVADLFVTRRLDDSWQKWSPPVNLGNRINSREEDSSIDVTLDGTTAYFVSSDEAEAKQDSTHAKGLFFAALPDSMRHTGAVLLTGTVELEARLQKELAAQQRLGGNRLDSARILIQAYSVRIENGKAAQTLVALAETSYKQREYALALPAGTIYYVKARIVGEEDAPLLRLAVDTRITNSFERRTHKFAFGIPARNLAFPPVRFQQEQSAIAPEYNAVLAWIADEIKSLGKLHTAKLTVTGHTCDLGTDDENDELSMQRAESVATLLESLGVEHAQMLVRGRGEKEPLERSQLDDARAKNRRVEFVLRRGQ